MAMQKGALTVLGLLFLTFQTFLPSEPSARVDGLNAVETPLSAAKNFNEALTSAHPGTTDPHCCHRLARQPRAAQALQLSQSPYFDFGFF